MRETCSRRSPASFGDAATCCAWLCEVIGFGTTMSSVLRLTVIAGLTCTAHSLLVTAKPIRTAVTTKKVDTNHAAVQELRKAFDLAPMHHEHEQQASAEKAHRTDFTQWCHSWSERQVTTVPGTVSSHTRRARMPFMMVAM